MGDRAGLITWRRTLAKRNGKTQMGEEGFELWTSY